jgi:hypothetical protein
MRKRGEDVGEKKETEKNNKEYGWVRERELGRCHYSWHGRRAGRQAGRQQGSKKSCQKAKLSLKERSGRNRIDQLARIQQAMFCYCLSCLQRAIVCSARTLH